MSKTKKQKVAAVGSPKKLDGGAVEMFVVRDTGFVERVRVHLVPKIGKAFEQHGVRNGSVYDLAALGATAEEAREKSALVFKVYTVNDNEYQDAYGEVRVAHLKFYRGQLRVITDYQVYSRSVHDESRFFRTHEEALARSVELIAGRRARIAEKLAAFSAKLRSGRKELAAERKKRVPRPAPDKSLRQWLLDETETAKEREKLKAKEESAQLKVAR